MEWCVEFTDEFEAWWNSLDAEEQVRVNASVMLVQKFGPSLGPPYSKSIVTSRHLHMKELRVQHRGHPYRVLFAFDPRRVAILLLGGNKTGDDKWYKSFVHKADRWYDEHVAQVRKQSGTKEHDDG